MSLEIGFAFGENPWRLFENFSNFAERFLGDLQWQKMIEENTNALVYIKAWLLLPDFDVIKFPYDSTDCTSQESVIDIILNRSAR